MKRCRPPLVDDCTSREVAGTHRVVKREPQLAMKKKLGKGRVISLNCANEYLLGRENASPLELDMRS